MGRAQGAVGGRTRGPAPPTVLGHEMHILNPALGWYVAHAWVWMDNPSGVFADWNPDVDCS